MVNSVFLNQHTERRGITRARLATTGEGCAVDNSLHPAASPKGDSPESIWPARELTLAEDMPKLGQWCQKLTQSPTSNDPESSEWFKGMGWPFRSRNRPPSGTVHGIHLL